MTCELVADSEWSNSRDAISISLWNGRAVHKKKVPFSDGSLDRTASFNVINGFCSSWGADKTPFESWSSNGIWKAWLPVVDDEWIPSFWVCLDMRPLRKKKKGYYVSTDMTLEMPSSLYSSSAESSSLKCWILSNCSCSILKMVMVIFSSIQA